MIAALRALRKGSERHVGQAVGVGRYGGSTSPAAPCRDDFIDCRKLRVTGLAFDSGYAEAMLVPATLSPPFPAGLNPEEARPCCVPV